MILEIGSISGTMPSWLSEPCFLGIDEAGRGPVLGPMVYACAIAPIANKEMLKNMEFDDSKQLTSERRLEMYQDIQTSEKILSFVNAVSAAEISAKMLARQRTSLNEIAEKCTIDLIRWAISQGANIQEVYVDTVGDSKSYQARLSALFDEISFVVCPKADSIYPIVSAASIVAKVYRDQALEEDIEARSDVPVGSGYPSDRVTKEWLERKVGPIFGWGKLVRYSWSTSTSIMDEKCAAVKWQVDDATAMGTNQSSMVSLFPTITGHQMSTRKLKHTYYKSRSIVRFLEW